jgi:hypothetical protein
LPGTRGGYVLGAALGISRDAEIQPNGVNSWSIVSCALDPNQGQQDYERRRQQAIDDCFDTIMKKWEDAHPGRKPTAEEFLDILDEVEDCVIDKGFTDPGLYFDGTD